MIAELLAEFPALLLVGPRASGKTATAVRHAHSVIRSMSHGRRLSSRLGVVLHTGPRVFSLDDRIIAAPVAALWS